MCRCYIYIYITYTCKLIRKGLNNMSFVQTYNFIIAIKFLRIAIHTQRQGVTSHR